MGVSGGCYEGSIPHKTMMLCLSGRALDCVAPATPRLAEPVPVALQRSVCPWLKVEQAALDARIQADPSAADEALQDFFKLVGLLRSVFFQSWAARLATASAPPGTAVHVHLLITTDTFRSFETTTRAALESAGDCAAAAVEQVLPQLATAVKAAVEAVAAESAADTRDLETRLSLQMDSTEERLQAHTTAGVDAQKAHGDAGLAEVKQLVESELGRARELLF